MNTPTPESHMRNAEWHAFRALIKIESGDEVAAREHLESAREWMAIAGIPGAAKMEATEIHGLAARARTGVIEG